MRSAEHKGSERIKVAIGIGSNLNEPRTQVHQAIEQLFEQEWFLNGQASALYRTKAVGPIPQPDYVNAVVTGETSLSAEKLLDALNQLEVEAGRLRVEHWGPRVLDLDILMMSDLVIDSDRVKIPHPEMGKRAFVLGPLCALAPDWLHPLSGLSVQDMLNNLPIPLDLEPVES